MSIKPCRLSKGSTFGIVAPASPWYDDEDIDKASYNLHHLGFNVIEGSSVRKRKGYLAGDDSERAKDINEFFARKDIDGIMCLRGGYGSTRLLDMIDYEAIKRNIKVFTGYSDITVIQMAIYKFCNAVTFHGPVLTNFINLPDDYTIDGFIKAVAVSQPIGKIQSNECFEDIRVMVPGEAEGDLIGGNLSMLTSLVGTPYEVDTNGKILFLEDVEEEPYRIDRMLTQLIQCGTLQECAGIILGNWKNCNASKPDKSLSLMEVLENRLSHLGIPVLYNIPSGHYKSKITLPFGVKTRISQQGEVFIEESGVI